VGPAKLKKVSLARLIVEDFLLLKIPKVYILIPNFKPYLMVKINEIWVPTTKGGLESDFGKVRFENPTPQEVLQFTSDFQTHDILFLIEWIVSILTLSNMPTYLSPAPLPINTSQLFKLKIALCPAFDASAILHQCSRHLLRLVEIGCLPSFMSQ
jgi:hypothetical protein